MKLHFYGYLLRFQSVCSKFNAEEVSAVVILTYSVYAFFFFFKSLIAQLEKRKDNLEQLKYNMKNHISPAHATLSGNQKGLPPIW